MENSSVFRRPILADVEKRVHYQLATKTEMEEGTAKFQVRRCGTAKAGRSEEEPMAVGRRKESLPKQ